MIEVLKQALEALEEIHAGNMTPMAEEAWNKAITSLRQTIAELESQEPVATVTSETGADITMSWWHEPALPMGTKLFTHPPQRTEQEPVAFDVTLDEAAVEMLNAFTSPLPPSLDEYNELRLMLGEGHSGYGLYLSMAEYPEEGAELLVNTRPLQRKPLTDKVLNIIASQWHMNLLVGKEKADVMSFARAIEAAHGIKE